MKKYPLYVVLFEEEVLVQTFAQLQAFLEIAVIHNKDITSFQVIDLSRKPCPISIIEKVIEGARDKGITLCGGALADNFTAMYLYF